MKILLITDDIIDGVYVICICKAITTQAILIMKLSVKSQRVGKWDLRVQVTQKSSLILLIQKTGFLHIPILRMKFRPRP